MTNLTDYAARWIESALGLTTVPRPEVVTLEQGWGALRENRSIHGTPLCLGGQIFARGLGSHAESELSVLVPSPADRFQALVGVDDNPSTRNAPAPCQLEFSLEAGGSTLWTSPVLTRTDAACEVDVELSGARQFSLKAREINGQVPLAHANWAEARVLLESGESTLLAQEGRALPKGPSISFVYDGQHSDELLGNWRQATESQLQSDGTTLHRKTYTDPETGLQCLVEMTQVPDFPAVEWVVRFKNTGSRDTPILEDVQALDFKWDAGSEDVLLHRSRGSHGQIEDFLYQSDYLHRHETFKELQDVVMTAGGGRSSQDWLPFFNVQARDEGFITAIGWSGQWKAEFLYSDGAALRTRIGMERTHLKLHPGEEIRTPRVLLMFWEGEVQESHNLLRRFLLKYHTPQMDGQPAEAPICSATWGGGKTGTHLANIESYAEKGLKYDCYWVDAGWYGLGDTDCPDVFVGDWGSQAGNWNVNRYRHPEGMRAISEAADERGFKFLLWFELQRAIAGTKLPEEHPDWFFASRQEDNNLLLNLGHPEALAWCIETISGYATTQGLDWYRQDFNINPLEFWRAADASDRQGISEIRNIEALYAFWDELRRRHPQLMIDNCASGGRCLDLETIGRSISLWRSDYQCFAGASPTGVQVQMTGLSHWLPLHTGGSLLGTTGDTYAFRSTLSAGIADQLTMYESGSPTDDEAWSWARQRLIEQKRLRPYFYGDFYALTPCTVSPDAWCVYQLQLPEAGRGVVMAFRREKSPFDRGTFVLHGLEPQRTYRLEDADSGESWMASGGELGSAGLELVLANQRSSKVVYLEALG